MPLLLWDCSQHLTVSDQNPQPTRTPSSSSKTDPLSYEFTVRTVPLTTPPSISSPPCWVGNGELIKEKKNLWTPAWTTCLATGLPASLKKREKNTTCVSSSRIPAELSQHAHAACKKKKKSRQKTAWRGQASRAAEMKRYKKKKKKRRLFLCDRSHPSSRHANVIVIINQMSWPELLRELSVCVCVCMSVCARMPVCVREALTSPLDITVSSLISGLFRGLRETGLDQLSYVGVFFEWHILWTMLALMFNPLLLML